MSNNNHDEFFAGNSDNELDSNGENQNASNVRRYNQVFNAMGQEGRNQRRRTSLQPFDDALSNHVCFVNSNIEEVSLSTLRSDDAIKSQLNFKYINVQILRIITSNQAGANVYSKKQLQISTNCLKFNRLFSCRIHSEKYCEENNELVYIMEARNQNLNLWSKNINQRDN